MSDTQNVEQFYDDFVVRSLNDYVYGNQRISAAVDLVVSHLPPTACRLLEIGCGMGVATSMIAARHPQCTIVAMDISPKRIDYAQKLFTRPNVVFVASDVEDFVKKGNIGGGGQAGLFDAIALLDVIEHLPTDTLASIEYEIGKLLKNDGKVILTCPTPVMQAYLRQNKPEEIQVIDNDINTRHVYEFSERIQAEVTYLQWITVWSKNDYVHAVLDRKPEIRAVVTCFFKKALNFLLRKIRSFVRKKRVKRSLGLDI